MEKNEFIEDCGCIIIFKGENNSIAGRHGMKGTRIYENWKGIKNRCFSSTKEGILKSYQNKGIGMCKQWSSFKVFYDDMGEKPEPSLSIDRVNNDKGYCPHNCRWATKKEQSKNRNPIIKNNKDKIKIYRIYIENRAVASFKTEKKAIDSISIRLI